METKRDNAEYRVSNSANKYVSSSSKGRVSKKTPRSEHTDLLLKKKNLEENQHSKSHYRKTRSSTTKTKSSNVLSSTSPDSESKTDETILGNTTSTTLSSTTSWDSDPKVKRYSSRKRKYSEVEDRPFDHLASTKKKRTSEHTSQKLSTIHKRTTTSRSHKTKSSHEEDVTDDGSSTMLSSKKSNRSKSHLSSTLPSTKDNDKSLSCSRSLSRTDASPPPSQAYGKKFSGKNFGEVESFQLPDDVMDFINKGDYAPGYYHESSKAEHGPPTTGEAIDPGDSVDYIKKFDIDCIGVGDVIVASGKRNSGKTYLLRDILYHRRKAPEVILFAGSPGTLKDTRDIIPPLFVHYGYDPDKVLDTIIRMAKINEKREAKGKPMRECIMIVEDLGFSDANVFDDIVMRFLISNGRHIGITVLISLQYLISMPTKVRFQIDYLFVFRDNAKDIIKRIYQVIGGVFENQKQFEKYFLACTPRYTCMVGKNVKNDSFQISDNIFYFKAQERPINSFKVGSKELWTYNALHLDRSKSLTMNIAQIIWKSSSAKKRKAMEKKIGSSSSCPSKKKPIPDKILLL
jgi:hypothetical protein